MRSDIRPARVALTPLRKLSLVLFGVLLALLLVEGGLRLAGRVFFLLQENRNRASALPGRSTRIMCIGESTTALGGRNSYPGHLERLLRERRPEAGFCVINKGIPAVTSTILLANIQRDIEECHPDVVVAMIGINDTSSEFGAAGGTSLSRALSPLASLRIVKLAAWIYDGLSRRRKGASSLLSAPPPGTGRRSWHPSRSVELQESPTLEGAAPAGTGPADAAGQAALSALNTGSARLAEMRYDEAEELLGKAVALNPRDPQARAELGWALLARSKAGEARKMFESAAVLDPSGDSATAGLAGCCRIEGDSARSRDLIMRALQLNHRSVRAYTELARYHADRREIDKAKKAYRAAIAVDPGSWSIYVELGAFLKDMQRYDEAEAEFARALVRGPSNAWAHVESARCYQQHGKYAQAGAMFEKAVFLAPRDPRVLAAQAECFREQKDYPRALRLFEEMVQLAPRDVGPRLTLAECRIEAGDRAGAREEMSRALALEPNDEFTHRLAASLCARMGDSGEVTLLREKAERLAPGSLPPSTRHNYRQIALALRARGIPLVCVQYPLRRIEPLKELFAGEPGIIFVDNSRVFADAVRDLGYSTLFTDSFAGDFGHCTPWGNRLLAGQVAEAILENFPRGGSHPR